MANQMKHNWALIFLVFSGSVGADVPPAQKPEVEHLLDFVQQSSCIIERNGTSYPASKAVSHIQKKYAYFKSDIETTEDFIDFSASKSTMSGNDYLVSCGDSKQIKTREWLLKELHSFRMQNT